MNVLDFWIDHIHSERDYTIEGSLMEFVEVDITTNCHGTVTRSSRVFERNDWERAKKNGKFLA